jgi:lipoprotein-anchoring transpeptidase ErfK/SrfK
MKLHSVTRIYSGLKGMVCLLAMLLVACCASAQTTPVPKPVIKPPVKQVIPAAAASAAKGDPVTEQAHHEKPRNLKVIDEHSDGKGFLVRTIQYDEGYMRVTETIFMPEHIKIGVKVPIRADTMNKEMVTLVVDKRNYCVQVIYRMRMIRAYKAVFGPHPMQDKMMEGDRCTPEGWFKITNKNGASQYDKFMLLSYPNDSAIVHFNKMKAKGQLPANARIGGSVGIHGIWPGGDDMIEMGVGWTDGCVALKNKDVEELFSMVGVGTKVHILK